MGENLNIKGVEACSAGRYLEAVDYFLASLEYDDETGYIVANLANAYYRAVADGSQEYISDTIKYAEMGLKKHNADAAYTLAKIYDPNIGNHVPAGYKDSKKAFELYLKYLSYVEEGLEYANAFNNIGCIYGEQRKDLFKAACFTRIAFVRNPDNLAAKENYGIYVKNLPSSERRTVENINSFDDIRRLLPEFARLAGRETGTEEAGIKETGIKETRIKETGTQEVETPETGMQEAGTPETGIKEDPYEKLASLVGLDSIKADVNHLVNLVKVQMKRKEKGLKQVPVSLHLVFSGNPGTGKTTIARILADIYKDIGILSKGQLVEVDRSGLVAGYLGQTAIKTQEKIKEAMGGILFIDEAYSLVKEGNDYGQEALETILKAMEDHRDDFVVIVAGYSDQMEKFINSNPGLKSRFKKYFHFPDYTAGELIQIFMVMCREYQYEMTDEAKKVMEEKVRQMEIHKGKNFANARDVRNMFEEVITRQATRLTSDPSANLTMIEAADFDS